MANLAAIITAPKAPLEVREVELYTPGPNEILVKNEVIAFNLVESKISKLGVIPIEYPAILGSAFGGTIESVGSSVTKFKVGDRVVASKKDFANGNQYGAYQKYVVVGDLMVSKLPEGMDLAVPASLMMNLTSVVGMFGGKIGLDKPSLDGSTPAKTDVKVLIYGGSSNFGGLSVQYLSQAGYKVTTTSSPKHRDFVSKLGDANIIDHTIDSDALKERLVADGPYDIVVDAVSLPKTIAITAQVLAAQGGGKLYAMQPAFESETLPDGVTRVFEKWPDFLYEEDKRELLTWVLETYVPQGISKGAITPLPVEKIAGGLHGINDALDKMLKGLSGVRLVADPWE
ncbi:hypothetical protein ONS95_013404 [Cadophora gregata]|uniref:uncharacterized protein n=1 Tax=Cadophora gregata TaxID=51156 RepID=UPI0026DA8970|nr:uncharacterized protein ONS95_013404 [Cadophora gregata]KAK0099703.1 hypothetical protein ONS96_008200 [Cadophora gregata f. sp. sojae]KAK0116384.1 hypothetical protein ONS95_013404 [Cadophora gregata]